MASSCRQNTSPYDSRSTDKKYNLVNTSHKYNNKQPFHSDDEIKVSNNNNQRKPSPSHMTNRHTNNNNNNYNYNNGGSPRKGFNGNYSNYSNHTNPYYIQSPTFSSTRHQHTNVNFNSDKSPASPKKEKYRSDEKKKCQSDEKENESNSVLYICTKCVVGPHACPYEDKCKYVKKHNCESNNCCKNDDERRSKDTIKKKGFIQTVNTSKDELIIPKKNKTVQILHGTTPSNPINADFARHMYATLEDGKNRNSPETVHHMYPDRKTRTLIRDNTISDVPCKFCITGSCTVINNCTNEEIADSIYNFNKIHNSQKEKTPNILKFTHIFGSYKPWSTTEMLGFISCRDIMKEKRATLQQQKFDDQFKEMSLKIKNQQELESSRLNDIVANDSTPYN